ncbi:hypothetical protein SSX86_030277 [Deinandra increscens subsp. villosa]|uniref:Patatin n=1 Tax=Deinandra increscens subsp. villosa TaxID=3103831 RepID=A0AAP0CC61_9ASTR
MLVAVSQVIKQQFSRKQKLLRSKDGLNSEDYGPFLVISIGTGAPKQTEQYNAKIASKWGALGWLNPLIVVFTQASGDMTDLHMSVFSQAVQSEENYLRIQDDTLSGDESLVDIATQENMVKLREIGENLLAKPASRINLETGCFEPIGDGVTNAEALKEFAKRLSKKRREEAARIIEKPLI